MITLLYTVAALAALWWLSKIVARGDGKAMARAARVVGGLVAIGAAAVLGLRGRIDMALLLSGLSAWLLGWNLIRLPSVWPFAARVPEMRSAMIALEVRSGALDGSVLAGSLAGRRLNDLDPAALKRLHEECRAGDPEGLRLLEAYLDRRFAGWRQDGEAHADAGRVRDPGAMSEEEAYQILGLQPGADADAVRRAHRSLMKKLHPDQGGTTYLAVRVNAAKEVLLSRHR